MRIVVPSKRLLFSLITIVAILAATATAVSQATSTPPQLRLRSVQVLDAKTVEATFTNPLATKNTDVSLRVFHAPHYDWDIPHVHAPTAIALTNGARTARITLDRGLHSDTPPCDGIEPRCSDDKLPFVVSKATDVYGQVLSNREWEVWAVGSGK